MNPDTSSPDTSSPANTTRWRAIRATKCNIFWSEPPSLQRILGHATLDMIERYVAVTLFLPLDTGAASPADHLVGAARS